MIHLLCQTFGMFIFTRVAAVAEQNEYWFSLGSMNLVAWSMWCLWSVSSHKVFSRYLFCVRDLQVLNKLLLSLKAGCECQFCTALCYFNVYPVNRTRTKFTQITGTLLKWLWLLTQKCIYNEMLGILWTTRWYFWIYWKQTNLCLITRIMMGYDLNLWWSQGCKQEHAWQNARKTVLYEKGNSHGVPPAHFWLPLLVCWMALMKTTSVTTQ